jgi:hypothetical protein
MVVASQREPLRLALDFFQLLSLSDDCRLQAERSHPSVDPATEGRCGLLIRLHPKDALCLQADIRIAMGGH